MHKRVAFYTKDRYGHSKRRLSLPQMECWTWKILVCRYAAVSHPNSYWSLVTPVTYSGKPNARSGVRPSVRPIFYSNFSKARDVFFPTLIGRATHTQRDSPGGSTRRGQHTFSSEYYDDGIGLLVWGIIVASCVKVCFPDYQSIPMTPHRQQLQPLMAISTPLHQRNVTVVIA